MSAPFQVRYSSRRAQYVIVWGRNYARRYIVPTACKFTDADAKLRAPKLCATLNRIYAPRAGAPLAQSHGVTQID